MNYVSVGDLAFTYQNRRQNVQIKTDLARLAQELASGQKSDLSTATSGDFSPIVGLERSLKANTSFSTSITEAGLFTAAIQTSLELVQTSSSELGTSLLTASSSDNPLMIQVTTVDAKEKFEAVISAFNTQVAGRYAFSGTATDRAALADADTILTALQSAIAPETTAVGVETAIDAWFDTVGGGFESLGYTGSNNAMAPFRLSESDSVNVELTAADDSIRLVLKGFAMAALIGEGALTGSANERTALARTSGERLLSADSTLAVIRGEIGSGEARIENAAARNIAEKSSLQIVRSELTAVDPYRAATELEALKTQLETLYTLTVRMSRLTLGEYLR